MIKTTQNIISIIYLSSINIGEVAACSVPVSPRQSRLALQAIEANANGAMASRGLHKIGGKKLTFNIIILNIIITNNY